MFSEQGLKDMQTMLSADGYGIEAREEGEHVVVEIVATRRRARTVSRRPR